MQVNREKVYSEDGFKEDFELGNKKISTTSFSPNNKLPPASEYEGMWDGRNNFGNPGGTTNSNFANPGI